MYYARLKVGAQRRLALILSGAVSLGGCMVGPDYHPPSHASLAIPEYYGVAGERGAPVDLSRWWNQFGDPLLGELIARATAGNLDIAVSEARLRQAREALIQTRSTLLPILTGSASETHTASYAKGGVTGGVPRPGASSASDTLSLGADASWQADIFGGNRRSVEASRANAQSALFQLAAVKTAVAGEVATNYIAVRLAQARLIIARETLATQNDNLEIAGWRAQAGLASSLDEAQARTQRAQTAAAIPLIETNLTSAIAQLGVLTGQAPSALRKELVDPGPIPQGPRGVELGIPADILRQRPDIRAAERDLAAASAQIGVSAAQLYPALTMSGSLATTGGSLSGLADLVTGSLFARLTGTIFDGGRLRSAVRSARDNADAAFATYKKTVLVGLSDVENGMQAFESAKRRAASLSEARDASSNAAMLARSQYRTGLIDFITLLQSEQTLLSTRDSLVTAQADQANALVQLYVALGGGWQSGDILSPDRPPA